jgi:hypothetical protein
LTKFIIIDKYVGFPGEGYNFSVTDVYYHIVIIIIIIPFLTALEPKGHVNIITSKRTNKTNTYTQAKAKTMQHKPFSQRFNWCHLDSQEKKYITYINTGQRNILIINN